MIIYLFSLALLGTTTVAGSGCLSYRDKCLPGQNQLYDYCISNQMCSHIPSAKCNNQQCQCQDGYRPNIYSCLAINSFPCRDSSGCFVNGSMCISGECKCPPGFYEKNYKCHPYAKYLGDACKHNKTCHEISGLDCSGQSCFLSGYVSQCVNGFCSCPDGFRRNGRKCIQENLACSEGYYLFNGRCLGHNGASCRFDNECGYINARCINWECRCLENSFLMDRACYPYAQRLGDSCAFPEACADIRNANCIDGKCQCPELTHHERAGNCWQNWVCSNFTECRHMELVVCLNHLANVPGDCCYLDETCREVEVWSKWWYKSHLQRDRDLSAKCVGNRCVCPVEAVTGYSGCFINWH